MVQPFKACMLYGKSQRAATRKAFSLGESTVLGLKAARQQHFKHVVSTEVPCHRVTVLV